MERNWIGKIKTLFNPVSRTFSPPIMALIFDVLFHSILLLALSLPFLPNFKCHSFPPLNSQVCCAGGATNILSHRYVVLPPSFLLSFLPSFLPSLFLAASIMVSIWNYKPSDISTVSRGLCTVNELRTATFAQCQFMTEWRMKINVAKQIFFIFWLFSIFNFRLFLIFAFSNFRFLIYGNSATVHSVRILAAHRIGIWRKKNFFIF